MTLSELTKALIERGFSRLEGKRYHEPFAVPLEDWSKLRLELQDYCNARAQPGPFAAPEECDQLHFLVMGTPITIKEDRECASISTQNSMGLAAS
jgi:hypothetical protein